MAKPVLKFDKAIVEADGRVFVLCRKVIDVEGFGEMPLGDKPQHIFGVMPDEKLDDVLKRVDAHIEALGIELLSSEDRRLVKDTCDRVHTRERKEAYQEKIRQIAEADKAEQEAADA